VQFDSLFSLYPNLDVIIIIIIIVRFGGKKEIENQTGLKSL